jgi:hypothetical protein
MNFGKKKLRKKIKKIKKNLENQNKLLQLLDWKNWFQLKNWMNNIEMYNKSETKKKLFFK